MMNSDKLKCATKPFIGVYSHITMNLHSDSAPAVGFEPTYRSDDNKVNNLIALSQARATLAHTDPLQILLL